LCVILEGE